MRWSLIAIVLSYAALATAEIALHAFMGLSHSDQAARIREWYFYRNPYNHKEYIMGYTVTVLPSVLMGLAAGAFGCKWKRDNILISVIALSIGIVALYPVYAFFLPNRALIYWPSDLLGRLYVVTIGFFIPVLLICGFFAYFGWAFSQWIFGRTGGPTT